MEYRKMFLVALCAATLVFSANAAAYRVPEPDCDNAENTAEFLKNANAGQSENAQNSVHLGTDYSQKLREHYEKLKQKADQFVGSSGTNVRNGAVNLNGESYKKFSSGGSSLSSSNIQSSGVNAGLGTAVGTNFYNNDGSLLQTVEGLKAHGQGVQFTATGGILPLKNYQEGQVYSHNNGGFGSSYEKHLHGASQHSSSVNSGLPQASITYTPTGWEKHHQSTSLNVEESIKKRNYTDFLQPEIISHQTNTVVHPLNIAYGAPLASSFNQGLKTHANYDNSNSGSYGLYQVPMTVIPVLGSNDANYLSETKSQSLSKTLVSAHDSTQGSLDAKPVKIQTGSYVRPTPAGIDQMWHKLLEGQTSSQAQNTNQLAVLGTNFGTTEAENEEHMHSYVSPVALNAPYSSQYASKVESGQSSIQSSHQSSSGSSASGHSQFQSQGKATTGERTPTNTFVGDPNAPQNSGYGITGENKGFYTKSVELANLLSAQITPMEENQNQNVQQNVQQGSSSSHYDVTPTKPKQVQSTGAQSSQQQSGYGTTFIEHERTPIIVSGGKSVAGSGYHHNQNTYEKHESSSSQFGKTQGSQILGGQESIHQIPVINEPYRSSGGYVGGSSAGSSYDWSTSGNGYGQYHQHRGTSRPSGYGMQYGAGGYGIDRSLDSQSWSSGSKSSSGRGVGVIGLDTVCNECSEVAGRTQYSYGSPTHNSYGLSSQFASSASNINGQKTESKSASVTINDNGKVDNYSRHTK